MGKKFNYTIIPFPDELYDPYHPKQEQNVYTLRTQKARGFRFAQDRVGPFGTVHPHGYVFPQTDMRHVAWPQFVRPCPGVPRHGFVDSRVVNDLKDFMGLYVEAKQADPDAEMIVMPFLSGRYSAVSTNAGITFGWGNDGVTAGGKGEVFHIPARVSPEHWMDNAGSFELRRGNLESIGVTTNLYIEMVENNGKLQVVQYRDGPAQPFARDIAPEPGMVPLRYLDGRPWVDNLLGWERAVKDLIGYVDDRGLQRHKVVVYAPNMPMSSHVVVHGLAAGFTVITSPQDEETYRKEERATLGFGLSSPRPLNEVFKLELGEEPDPLTAEDYRWIAAEAAAYAGSALTPADTTSKSYLEYTALTAIGTVQGEGVWGPETHLKALRAFAPPTLLRLTFAAVFGELRHWWTGNGPGRNSIEDGDDDDDFTGLKPKTRRHLPDLTGSDYNRWDIYDQVLSPDFLTRYPLRTIHAALRAAEADFTAPGWSTSYGGPGWAQIAREARLSLAAYRRFLKTPSQGNWQALIMDLNKLINTAHNNGSAFNKYINYEGAFLDQVSTAPQVAFTNPCAAELVLTGNIVPPEQKDE